MMVYFGPQPITVGFLLGNASQFLPWYQLEALRLVSRGFKQEADLIIPKWPGWLAVLNQLNLMNRFDICFHCESSLAGECNCVHDDAPYGWIEHDPRRAPDFLSLPPHQQFRNLLSFHQQCIANLLSFYPLDLSIDRNDNWYEECVMSQMRERNPQVLSIMGNLVELQVSCEDIGGEGAPYWFRSAFDGVELDPNTGSSFCATFFSIMSALVCIHPQCPDESHVLGIHGDDTFSKSQFECLDRSIEKLMAPDPSRVSLFGPVADSVDVFAKHRALVSQQLTQLFPLNWMPLMGPKTSARNATKPLELYEADAETGHNQTNQHPIHGLMNQAVPLTLAAACACIKLDPDSIKAAVEKGRILASKNAGNPLTPMNQELYGALVLYLGHSPAELYGPLNASCREWIIGSSSHSRMCDSCIITPHKVRAPALWTKYSSYLRLLLEAMNQLPPHQGRLWVGMPCDLDTEEYAEGKEVVWYSMRSCTTDENVARKFVAMFADTKICTLLILDVQHAVDMTPIHACSGLSENEVLLAAGTTFQVITRKRVGMVNEIHLTEVGSILT